MERAWEGGKVWKGEGRVREGESSREGEEDYQRMKESRGRVKSEGTGEEER